MNNANEHTPGPWRTAIDSGAEANVETLDGDSVALCFGQNAKLRKALRSRGIRHLADCGYFKSKAAPEFWNADCDCGPQAALEETK